MYRSTDIHVYGSKALGTCVCCLEAANLLKTFSIGD